MTRKALLTLLALAFVSAAGLAFADDKPAEGSAAAPAPVADKAAEGRWAKRGKMIGAALKKMGVSPENMAKLKELWAEWKKTREPLRNEARAKARELRELFKAETIDAAKADALAGEIAEKRAALIKARISHRVKALSLLSVEQRKKLWGMRKKMRNFWRSGIQKMRMKMLMKPVGE